MAETPPNPWDSKAARRFVCGSAILEVAALVQALGALAHWSRAVLLSFLVPMLMGGLLAFTGYKAAGEPQGHIFAVGRPAAVAAGLPSWVWDGLVLIMVATALLHLLPIVI